MKADGILYLKNIIFDLEIVLPTNLIKKILENITYEDFVIPDNEDDYFLDVIKLQSKRSFKNSNYHK